MFLATPADIYGSCIADRCGLPHEDSSPMAHRKLSLRARFAFWTSLVIVALTAGLTCTVYVVSARTVTSLANQSLDDTTTNTAQARGSVVERP